MAKNLCKRILLIAVMLSQYAIGYAQEKSAESVDLYFRFDKTKLEENFKSNAASLQRLEELLTDDAILDRLDSITVMGVSTPEGGHAEYNAFLATRRAKSTVSYLEANYPDMMPLVSTSIMPESWDLFRTMVEKSTLLNHKQKVLDVIDASVGVDTKRWRLKQIDGGKEWERLNMWIFPNMRVGSIVSLHLAAEQVEVQSIPEPEIEDVEEIKEAAPVVEEVVEEVVEPVVAPKKTILALKTNLAAYAALVFNLGVEVPLGEHMTIDFPVYYSPYTIFPNYNFRVLATQPELRYWFTEGFDKHFVGVHALAGYYNCAWNSETRYQDKNGDTPCYGFGVSYGYQLDLKKNWALEFTFGLGYARFNSDLFYNTHNGARYDTKAVDYWGPTKLGVSLVYEFKM